MRKKSKITHHRRQVPSRPGRRAGMSSGADTGEFSVAYMVAFQHAILHPVSTGDGFHDLRGRDASAISPRKTTHAFLSRCPKEVKQRGVSPQCHSERSEESLINSGTPAQEQPVMFESLALCCAFRCSASLNMTALYAIASTRLIR